MATLAIIGGTGFTRLPNLTVTRREMVKTPFGAPSCPLVFGKLDGTSVAFLARHGSSHRIPPHRINYRANLWALQSVGIEHVVAVGAVGGIAADCSVGSIVIPDQIIDYTHGRDHTFFDGGDEPMRHIDFTEPYDADLRKALLGGAHQVDSLNVVDGGCYGAMDGPRLETAAEIRRLERDGCTVVGLTGMPEAVLARELNLAYATLAVVVNAAAGKGNSTNGIDTDALASAIDAGMDHARATITHMLTGSVLSGSDHAR